jgi:hypothetical protein
MSDTKIKTSNIGNLAVTHALLHTDMDLTSKTVQVATPTSNTHPATKAYVDTEVANLIDSAPGTLDTLNELAAAINDDANFNATIASSIATKLPLAGGTLTGNLTLASTASGSSASPELELRRDITGADANYLGQIKFTADNDADQNVVFAKITGKILDASDGTEDGIIEFAHKKAGSNNISARFRSDSLQLINGTNLTVAGTTDLTGDLTVDTNTLHVDTSNNKVGIGTTSPGVKFEVQDDSTWDTANFTSASTVGAGLTLAATDTGARWSLIAQGTTGGGNDNNLGFHLTNAGTSGEGAGYKFVMTPSGRLGIGTSSPTARLSFGNYIPSNGQTIHTYQGGNTVSGLGIVSGEHRMFTNDGSILSYGHVSASDGSTYTERMRIDSSGNVAIGTTGPVSSGYDTGSTKLTVMSTTLNNATSGYLELASRANSNGYNAGAIQFNNFENAGVAGSGVQNRTVGQIRTIIATTDSNAGDDSGGTMEFYTKSEAGNLTQNMTIHSNGNVGIGTSNPGSLLSVNGPAALANLGGGSTGSSALYVNTTSGHVGEMIQVLRNGAIKMYMANDGDLALGHSSPSDKLDIQGADNGLTVRSIEANRPVIKLINGSSTMLTLSANGSYAAIGGAAGLNDYMLFHPNSGNRVIASGGAINLHNANTAGWALNGNGNLGQANFSTNNNRPLILHRYNGTGQIAEFGYNQSTIGSIDVTASGTTYNTTSDCRLKDNIEPIADATDKLMDMKPVTHTWIDNPDEPQVHGFIAQEMQEVVPEAVSGDAESDEMMSMDYGRITPVIVAALQDALNEIKELKTRIDVLENK